MATAAERRAAELARLRRENEARKQRIAEQRGTAPTTAAATAVAQAPAVLNEFQEATPGVYFDLSRLSTSDIVAAISGGPDLNQFMEQTPGLPVGTAATTRATTTVTRAVTTAVTAAPSAEDIVLNIAIKKLSQYNLKGIADSLQRAREAYPELELTDLLFIVENDDRYNQPFKDRFKANQLRESKGLPKLSAADYLAMEEGYKNIFRTYNLPMFSNQTQFDKLIANDIDVDDTVDRVVMAYDRVMTDTSTRNAFRQFYGSLTDADIVSALLDPAQQIPALEKKVIAAEIGGQALRQGP